MNPDLTSEEIEQLLEANTVAWLNNPLNGRRYRIVFLPPEKAHKTGCAETHQPPESEPKK